MSDQQQTFNYEAAIAACARGERFALQAIYAQDGRWLLAVALRMLKRKELAEEVLHDAFVQIWTRASQYRPSEGSARAWVFTIVRNHALNVLRQQGRWVSVEETVIDEPACEDRSFLNLSVGELSECMGHLDSMKRQAILLAFIEGQSHEQVANTMGAPLGSVKSWIRRGLLSLKECLS